MMRKIMKECWSLQCSKRTQRRSQQKKMRNNLEQKGHHHTIHFHSFKSSLTHVTWNSVREAFFFHPFICEPENAWAAKFLCVVLLGRDIEAEIVLEEEKSFNWCAESKGDHFYLIFNWQLINWGIVGFNSFSPVHLTMAQTCSNNI